MLIRETEDYQDSLINIGRYLKEVDKEQNTHLFYEFPVSVDETISYISKWPEASTKYKKYRSRRVTINKFTSYYLLYHFNENEDTLTLLEVRGCKQDH